MAGPLIVVDAPSLMYRSFFALPKSIRGADGKPVNALLGTANALLAAWRERKPRALVCCWGAEAAKYRVKLYPRYHADRPPMPPALARQWKQAPAFFEAFGWASLDAGQLEADDLIGSLVASEERAGGRTLMFSGDRDMFQCVSGKTRQLYPARGGVELIGVKDVRERAGVAPARIPDLIALRGDPSDGIPGARGVGEKGAVELLGRYKSLDGVIAAAGRPDSEMPPAAREAILEQEAQLRDFLEMATLQPVKVRRPRDRKLNEARAARKAEEMGMARLADRLRGGEDAFRLSGPATGRRGG